MPASPLRVSAVIFDMDGVVIDSGDVYARHWRDWGAGHGIPFVRIDRVHHGLPPVETIRRVAPHLDAVAEARRFNVALDDNAETDRVTAMPGAATLLASLPAHRWGIATSAVRAVAPRWLRQAGLPEPAVLVTVEDVARGKPAPDPYLRAAELLDVPPVRCLVIEDAPAGIEAGRAAGATVMAVLTTHGPTELTGAHVVVRDLTQVSAVPSGDDILITWES